MTSPPLLTLLFGVACGLAAGPPSPPTREDVVPPPSLVLLEVPVPPPDSLVQFYSRETGQLERVLSDGRWLVQPPGGTLAERRPESYYEPGQPRLGRHGGLRRLGETLSSVGFFDLPARVASVPPPPGAELPGGQGPVRLHTYAFSAYDPAGMLHVVEVEGDLRAPDTFGVLAPLVRSLDREVWGFWKYE